MKKINCALLVDDDEITNFYNEHILRESGMVDEIIVASNGQEAFDILEKEGKKPELILLDINMPVMNGFEFLDKLNQKDVSEKESIIICLLTTSLHPKDKEQSKKYNFLDGYVKKPLTKESLEKILDAHFNK